MRKRTLDFLLDGNWSEWKPQKREPYDENKVIITDWRNCDNPSLVKLL